MEGLLTILVFIGVIAVTALVFCVWVVVTIIRLVARGIGAVVGPVGHGHKPRLPPMPAATRGIACANAQCKAVNPGTARFCRRCGRELPEVHRVSVRRAAML
jgi:hypothetical protein